MMPSESARFIVESVDQRHGFNEIGQALAELPGICFVGADSEHHFVAVDYDSASTSYDAIENRLNRMGFEIAADASLISTR